MRYINTSAKSPSEVKLLESVRPSWPFKAAIAGGKASLGKSNTVQDGASSSQPGAGHQGIRSLSDGAKKWRNAG